VDIQLDSIRAQGDGPPKGRQAVFERVTRGAAVGDDEWRVGHQGRNILHSVVHLTFCRRLRLSVVSFTSHDWRRPMSSARRWFLMAAVTLAVGLAACSDTNAPGGDDLSASEASDAGDAMADEIGDVADAMDLDVIDGGEQLLAQPHDGLSFRLAGPPHAGCASISSLLDSDGDGTPDDATFTYTLPDCHFVESNGATLELTGVITVTDPMPDVPGLGRTAQLADFTRAVTRPGAPSFVAVRNGTRQRSGSESSLTLNNNVTVHRTVEGRDMATIVHTLQFVFDPEAGSTVEPGEPLPDGTITVSGALNWSRDGHVRDFTVSTASPLVYDASCAGSRRDRIASGELRWALPGGRVIVTTWTACGVPPTRRVLDVAN
jgi:hypothetical protein